MLKSMLVLSALLNVFLVFTYPQKPESYIAETGNAYLVVSQKLKKMIGPQSGELMWSKYCPHVSGKSVKFNSLSRKVVSEASFNDVPLTVESAYRYDAQLSVECSPVNLNCYRFDNLEVEQRKILSPKL